VYEKGTVPQDEEERSQVVVVRIDARRSDEVVVHSRDPAQNRYSEQTVYGCNSRYDYVSPEDPAFQAVYLDSIAPDVAELTRE
jgi:hypothetical protein